MEVSFILDLLKQKADMEELVDQAPVLKDKAEVLSEESPKPVQEPATVEEPAVVRIFFTIVELQ